MDFKKLTVEEVANKRFTSVRMREGYSIDEVDKFLEKMEETIETYDGEVFDLQKQVSSLEQLPELDSSSSELEELKRAHAAKLRELEEAVQNNTRLQNTIEGLGLELVKVNADLVAARQGRAAAETLATAANDSLNRVQAAAAKPMDAASASGAAARILENAAKNYDELLAQGEAEAKAVIEKAEVEATDLRSSAERQAAEIIAEVNSAKEEAFGDIESQKRQLEESVAHLASVETRARDELVRVYSSSLEELQKSKPAVNVGEAIEPRTGPQRVANPLFGDVPAFIQ